MDRTKFPNLSEEFLDQMEKLEKEDDPLKE